MPPWSAAQVNDVSRDLSGRVKSIAPPSYAGRSSPRQQQLDPATWMRLHQQTTHAMHNKQLEAKSPRLGWTRPPDQRPFPQPSVPSPRGLGLRPASARAYNQYAKYMAAASLPLDNFPPFKNISPRIVVPKTPPEAAPAPDKPPTPVKPPTPQKKKSALELVSPDEIRKAAASLKEKLIDKFGNLTRAFRAIDADGSGVITRDELERYLEIINLNTGFSKNVTDALWELIDADESGSFDFKEFSRVMSAGDVMKMEKVKDYHDGFKEKADEAAAADWKRREIEAAQVGMTVEEYDAYYAGNKRVFGAASTDMAQVGRDRWGHKIKGSGALAYNT